MSNDLSVEYSILGMNWIVVFREMGVLSMNFPLNVGFWWYLGFVCLILTLDSGKILL